MSDREQSRETISQDQCDHPKEQFEFVEFHVPDEHERVEMGGICNKCQNDVSRVYTFSKAKLLPPISERWL